MSQTRQSWEPARTPSFYAGLAANQTVFSGQFIVHGIIATNKGASAATMAIYTMQNGSWAQIATLGIAAGATAALPLPSSGLLLNGLNITPSAALDVTVLRP